MPIAFRRVTLAVVFMTIGLLASSARATILTFDNDLGVGAGFAVVANSAPIPQAYGDNVSALTQPGFGYGVGTEGFTPNVTVEYGIVANPAMFTINLWDNGYGDLTNVGWSGPFTQINLTKTGTNKVSLYSLDMATFGADSLGTVTISDENDAVLYSSGSVVFSGSSHTAFDFSSSPLTADVIKIGLTGASSFYGIDNIRFGEAPEPASLSLLSIAGLLMFQRRSKV